MADESKRTVLLEFEVDVDQSIESINKLTAANKALRAERNNLNLNTEAGKKRAQELNATIDQNTAKIKENVSAIEQQKINIGNYASALDKVVPGMGQFTQNLAQSTKESGGFASGLKAVTSGIWGAVKASLAFLATPLGIAIAAIAAAFALLREYLTGTQEGMDKITAITRPLGALFERLVGVIQVLGGKAFKALGEAIKNPIQAFKDLGAIIKDNIIKRFEALALFGPALKKIFGGDIAGGFKDLGNATIQATTGVENGIDKIKDAATRLSDFVDEAWEQGRRLDELQKLIERGEIDQIVRTQQLNLLIKQQKAIVEDETKSYQERIKAAQTARKAQDEILRTELIQLDRRIEKMRLEQSLNDTSREQEKELAELIAKRLELQARVTEQAIEFDKKINEIRNKETASQEAVNKYVKGVLDSINADRKAIAEQKKAQAERTKLANDFVTQTGANSKVVIDIAAREAKRKGQFIVAESEQRRKAAEIQKMLEEQKLDAAMSVTDGILGLLDQQGNAYKAIATAQTLVSTYTAAQKAYEAAFLPIPTVASPALGVAFAAAAILKGLANVAAINNIQFAEGGYTGPGGKFEPAGVVHRGEVVWSQKDVALAGGPQRANALRPTVQHGYFDGGIVTRSISSPIDQQSVDVMSIVRNMPAPEVSVKEINKVQKQVQVKQKISKR